MKSKVVWSEQVQCHVNGKAPEPRRALWQQIKKLADWDGAENPPRIRHLEDELSGYSRLRVGRDRIVFRQEFEAGARVIKCAVAGPRNSIYETFADLLIDELAD